MPTTFHPQHWRRALAKSGRRPVRALRAFRPRPAAAALVLGVVLGTGAAIGAAVAGADQGPAPAGASTPFHGHPGMSPTPGGRDGGWDGWGGGWDDGWDGGWDGDAGSGGHHH